MNEIEELRARLDEAEETLRAIRHGEVDALLIETQSGQQIYTLQGLDAELNRFRGEILEKISEVVIVLDEAEYIIYVNGYTEQQYGISTSKIIGCHISKLYRCHWHNPDDEKTKNEILATDGQWRGENTHIKNDGKSIYVESQITRLKANRSMQSGQLIVIRDITARKQAEQALNNSQIQLRLFIQQAPLSIAMFDREMKFLVASDHWKEEFGRDSDDLVGFNYYEVNKNIPEEWQQIHKRALAGEFLRNNEDMWIKEDGSRQWFRWMAYPWTNDNGEIGGIIISSENITARHVVKEELLTAQTRLSLILQEVKACYWDWNLSSGKIYASPEWDRQMEFEDGHSPGTWAEWVERVHPKDKEFVLSAKNDCLSGLKPNFEVQYRIEHQNGSYRHIHSRGVLILDQHGNPDRVLGINLDMTDYMRSRELKEQRDKIEKATQLYVASQTAAAIAHELNQPLTALTFYGFAAKKLLTTSHPDLLKLADIIDKCDNQIARAADVIRHLMFFLHKGEISYELVDVNKLIRHSLDYVRASNDFSTTVIQQNLANNLPLIRANALQIQKVIINLLINAMESMETYRKNRMLTISTCKSPEDSDVVLTSVKDSGKGVSDRSVLNKMFQAFYTTKSTGLGMGLAISRALIEAHGGKMWAEENDDVGICIYFTLPIAP